MTISALVFEDNGGGLSLYVLNGEVCIYAHMGYEYALGQLLTDLRALNRDGGIDGWEGNNEALVDEYNECEGCFPTGSQEIASLGNGVLHSHHDRMGASGRAEFGHLHAKEEV